VLVNVHLILDLLAQALLLLVLRFRAARNHARLLLLVLVSKCAGARNAGLLVLVSECAGARNSRLLVLLSKCAGARNARLLVLVTNSGRGRARNASGLSCTDVASCVGTRGSACGKAGVDGVGLHALTLDVRVLADLLAASGGDGAGVDDAMLATLLGGLCHCNGATATELGVGRAEGGGNAAADSLVGSALGGV
jgi:hypothetical protein